MPAFPEFANYPPSQSLQHHLFSAKSAVIDSRADLEQPPERQLGAEKVEPVSWFLVYTISACFTIATGY